MNQKKNEAELLVEDIAGFVHDPLGYVHYAFPWGKGDLEKPRQWQSETLQIIGDHLSNPETRFTPLQIAIASGHGIGKSSFVGMVCNWALSTCEDTKIIITANTATQLATKTMPEITKWTKLAINSNWFDITATSIYAKARGREKLWRLDAIPWSISNTEAFAGAHNKDKRLVIVFDEASAIDDKIWEVIEGALTDENTEIIWLAFGNPTRNVGRFRECFRKYKHRWITKQIDSRTVEGTNKKQIQKWIDDYGIDSDFVKVRVRGMHPSTSLKQFISTDDVDAAFGRQLHESQYMYAPKILTVDPSWEGDDEFVIGLRQGLVFSIVKTFQKNDNDVQMANIIMQIEDELKADAVFVDAGYGTGIVSVARTLGRNWMLVWFGEKASRPEYLNKRSEMWAKTKQWLKDGGCIPKDHTLYQDLITPEAVARVDGKIQLESKKDIKARGLPSPNRADALVISFAYPVQHKNQIFNKKNSHKSDYDPFAD